MVPRSALLLGLLAPAIAFGAIQQQHAVSASRAFSPRAHTDKALRMSGGEAAPVPEIKPPPALYAGAVAAGAAKAKGSWSKIFKLGIVSGCHIGFGAFLMLAVGGACPEIAANNPGLKNIISGAFGLPFGLIMTLVTGGELFTGNTALVGASFMEGKTTKGELAKSWIGSYAGNLVGSLFLAYLAFHGGTLGASCS